MSKVTIYNRDGTVFRQTECVEVQPYYNSFHMVLLDQTTELDYQQRPRKWFVTNLPFAVEGATRNESYRQPEDSDPTDKVELYSDNATLLRIWSGARGVCYYLDIVNFKIGSEWLSICGNIVITPEERK